MQRPRLDRHVDRLAVRDPRAWAESADHDRFILALGDCRLHGALLTDVAGELADVLGERGRSVDGEVGDDLGAKRLLEYDNPAQPALTEDVRELARDVGQESAVQTAVAEDENEAVMVGRFGPRSRISNGETIDVAVETGALHFFDLDTGLGIYGVEQTTGSTPSNDGEGAHG